MSPEEKAAYINSQVACAMIEAMGMQAENAMRAAGGVQAPRYYGDDFANLAIKYGIYHNAVMTFFQG